MAGDWIKIMCSLVDDAIVLQVSRVCGISKDESLGKLVRLLVWADARVSQMSRSGLVGGMCVADVDTVVECDGVGKALVDGGWLREHRDSIEFIDWDKHNGKSAKARVLALESKRRQRRDITETSPRQKRDQKGLKKEKEKELKEEPPLPPTAGGKVQRVDWDLHLAKAQAMIVSFQHRGFPMSRWGKLTDQRKRILRARSAALGWPLTGAGGFWLQCEGVATRVDLGAVQAGDGKPWMTKLEIFLRTTGPVDHFQVASEGGYECVDPDTPKESMSIDDFLEGVGHE